MSGKQSKQLGALLNRVPAATAAGQGATLASRPVPYAPLPEPDAQAVTAPAPNQATDPLPSTPPLPARSDKEVPLQVLIPEHVREQLDMLRARSRKSIRQLTLEALRSIGLNISDKDIAGKRGRKKS